MMIVMKANVDKGGKMTEREEGGMPTFGGRCDGWCDRHGSSLTSIQDENSGRWAVCREGVNFLCESIDENAKLLGWRGLGQARSTRRRKAHESYWGRISWPNHQRRRRVSRTRGESQKNDEACQLYLESMNTLFHSQVRREQSGGASPKRIRSSPSAGHVLRVFVEADLLPGLLRVQLKRTNAQTLHDKESNSFSLSNNQG